MRAQTDKHELATLWKKVEAIGRRRSRHPRALGIEDKTASSSSGSKGCGEAGRKCDGGSSEKGFRSLLRLLWVADVVIIVAVLSLPWERPWLLTLLWSISGITASQSGARLGGSRSRGGDSRRVALDAMDVRHGAKLEFVHYGVDDGLIDDVLVFDRIAYALDSLDGYSVGGDMVGGQKPLRSRSELYEVDPPTTC